MSTIYTLDLKSAADDQMTITVTIPFAGDDTWSVDPSDALSADYGHAVGWLGPDVQLYGGLGADPLITLEGVTKSIDKDSNGAGENYDPDGKFPAGKLTWMCTSKK
jgi:hypothetical protein